MADAQQYGPSVPAVTTQTEVPTGTIAPALAQGLIKEEMSNSPHTVEGQTETPTIVGAVPPGSMQGSEGGMAAGNASGMSMVGVLAPEVNHGDEVVQAAAEFERQSRKMKGQMTIKAEAEPGPTDMPAEMGKSIGVTARTYVKPEDKDHAEWTDAQADKLKKDKESKSKKRKRDDGEKNPIKQQQIDDLSKKKGLEPVADLMAKPKKKAKKVTNQNAAADSTQLQAPAQPHPPASTQTPSHPIQQLTPQQQQQLQQQQQQQQQQQTQVVQAGGDQLQFMHLSDDIRDSLDLLSPDQKTSEYYSGEFQNTEFNESKPLADLLLNQNMVSYNQDGTLLSQGGTVLGTSQMIAQAYNQAQQLSTSSLNQHQLLASGLASQMGGQMGITIIPAPTQDGQTTLPESQTAMVTDEAQGSGTIQTINGATYTSSIVGSSQPSGSSSISAFPLGQNVIIASPGTPQQAGNFIFTSTGQVASGMGQNIVLATPGQAGGYIVKQETQEELAQTLVLASQNPQQTLGPNVIMGSSTQHTATLGDGTSVVFTHPPPAATPTSETQPGGKAITITSKSVTGAIPAPSATIQTQGGMQPVSLVLPPGSFLPQLQNMGAAAPTPTSPNLMQMSAKMDKMLVMMQETVRAITEANKRLDRLEAQVTQNAPKSKKSKSSSSSSSSTITMTPASTASSSVPTSAASPGQSKSELKAALADYLTITGFNNKDELKRNESSSDLFIPVGTVSLPVAEAPSPSGETATSTVSELPDRNLLVLNNAAPVPIATGSEVAVADVAAPDSQSGIAVTIYDSEGGTYELGPDSSKDNAGARFTTVSQNPKTVIVDPKFWEMLVEDFQKNMTSKQIMSALANIRKPLVRNMGNNEISICSSVLKEAEEACQGRRERLAKELVFRIFTLGEVYDRNVSGVFYIKGKKMENRHKALDPAKMSAIRFLVMRYPPSVLDNPRLEKLVWKNCVDRINDALRRIYNWIHKLVDINSIIDKLPTNTVLQSP